MDMQIFLNQMASLFLLIAVGFTAGKLKILTQEGNKVLSKIVLFIALPCTILSSVLDDGLDILPCDTSFFLLMSLTVFAIAFAVAIPLVRLSRGDKANHGLLIYMSVFSNSAFMGLPVAIALFGVVGAYFTALFSIWFNVLSFSVGILLVAGKGSSFNPKLLINPPLIAALLAIPLSFTDFQLPYAVTNAMRFAGAITTPGAMIVIGSSLAYITIINVFSEWRVGLVTALRLVIIPLITWLVFRQFVTNDIMLGVLVVISAMPSAAQSTMLAIQYDGNDQIASAGIFTTTLLCGFTVPLIVYFLLM